MKWDDGIGSFDVLIESNITVRNELSINIKQSLEGQLTVSYSFLRIQFQIGDIHQVN